MITVDTMSAAETRALGERLAPMLRAGDVLLLSGELGAGKSELTRGIARGLGVAGYVPSPSFTILQTHETGRIPLYHFDWYRLAGADELYELALDEYLYGAGISVVEWPEQAVDAVPDKYLLIRIEQTDDEERRITLEPIGGFRELDAKAVRG